MPQSEIAQIVAKTQQLDISLDKNVDFFLHIKTTTVEINTQLKLRKYFFC